jgi:hypothetical protein
VQQQPSGKKRGGEERRPKTSINPAWPDPDPKRGRDEREGNRKEKLDKKERNKRK